MTISSQTRKAGPFNGNDATTAFPFAFKVFAASNLQVVEADDDGVETILTLTSDYTVSLNTNQNTSPGGTVTLNSALATGHVLVVTSDVGYLQPTDLTNQGGFYPTVINDALDRLTIQTQQLNEQLGRSAKLPITSAADAESLVADIVLLADNAASIATVAGAISSVNTVATNIADVSAVSAVAAEVNAVGDNIAAVVAVDSNETNINAVAANATNINAVAGNEANIDAVAGNATNIDAVAGNETNIDAVAGVSADVTTVAGIAANVTTVAGIDTEVAAVAGIDTEVAAVAGIAGDVTAVAGNAADISAVAAIAADVTAVAAIDSDVAIAADNIAAIVAAPTHATTATTQAGIATTKASEAAASAALAAAIALGVSSGRPTIRPTLLLDFANTKQLDPRVTFTRASTGTYYDGVTTVKAEENLLLYSQQFDDAYWSKSNGAVSANSTTAPDGTTTADTFTPAVSGSTTHRLFRAITLTNSAHVISFYVKANGYSKVGIREVSVGGYYATFDLVAETVLDSTAATGSVVDVGGGWLRIIMSFTATAGSNIFSIYPLDNSYTTGSPTTYNFTADGTSGICIWGAQIEQRSSVTAYTPTTTQPITKCIPKLLSAAANVPRLAHNPATGESLGVVCEGAATNLFTYSEDFSNAAWTKDSCTITSNSAIAPDGTLTMDELVLAGTDGSFYTGFSGVTGTVTQSAYVKKNTADTVYFIYNSNSNKAVFNPNTGAVVSVVGGTASIEDVGNETYRIKFTPTHATTARSYIGATGTAGESVFIWGAQLETGSKATSYIKTEASTVTRAADVPVMTGTNFSSWFNQAEGALVIEYLIDSVAGSTKYALALDGGASNYIELAGANSSSKAILYSRQSGTLDVSITSSANVNVGTVNKAAFSYKANDYSLALNGAIQGTDTTNVVPVVTSLEIGRYNEGSPGGYLNGTIKRIAYYPKRLSDAQLQVITE